jgi:hypothetical protein
MLINSRSLDERNPHNVYIKNMQNMCNSKEIYMIQNGAKRRNQVMKIEKQTDTVNKLR